MKKFQILQGFLSTIKVDTLPQPKNFRKSKKIPGQCPHVRLFPCLQHKNGRMNKVTMSLIELLIVIYISTFKLLISELQ